MSRIGNAPIALPANVKVDISKGNLVTVLLAGEDTTANTLAWSIYLLTKYPDYQTKLQSEIDEALGELKCIAEYETSQGCKFLEAVANETMRLKPVAPPQAMPSSWRTKLLAPSAPIKYLALILREAGSAEVTC